MRYGNMIMKKREWMRKIRKRVGKREKRMVK